MILYNFKPEEKVEFFKYLFKFIGEEETLALYEVLGDDLYFVLFLFAGKTIEFPDRLLIDGEIKRLKKRVQSRERRRKKKEEDELCQTERLN